MTDTKKKMIIFAILIIAGFVLGRLAFRGVLNMLLGGTMFGGDIL